MELSFYKIHLAFRDYIIVNSLTVELPSQEELRSFVRSICQRNSGVGARGVLLLVSDREHSGGVRFFDYRGEERQPGPEALICLARYAFDYGLAHSGKIVLQSLSGPKELQCIDSSHFSICAGTPTSDGRNRIFADSGIDYQVHVKAGHRSLNYTPVHLDQSIAAVHVEGDANLLRRPLELDIDSSLPVAYTVLSKDEARLLSPLEENVDIIQAAAGIGVAAVANGFCEKDIVVYLEGNNRLFFEWNERSNTVYIAADPRYAFSGYYTFGEDEYGPVD